MRYTFKQDIKNMLYGMFLTGLFMCSVVVAVFLAAVTFVLLTKILDKIL